MDFLGGFDYFVIFLYMAFLIGLGFYLKNKASSSIEDYFIGGRSLPWWALGVSGMASWLDITGTMIIVSFIYMLGPRGLYIEFRGGAGLVMPALLIWVGKWFRRSQCITGAEWMIYRFGDNRGGQAAQLITAVSSIVLTIGMIAYMVIGVGLFLSTFLPWPPHVCAAGLIVVATLYTMVSGFYGVVFTDLFQSLIILIAVVGISILAITKVNQCENLAALTNQVTHNPDWFSSCPHWKTVMPKGYEPYSYLMMFAMFYLAKNFLDGIGNGGDPKFFGARNDRECGLLAAMWTFMMMFRWPLIIGFALLGIFLVHDKFPDQNVLIQAADLIKDHTGIVNKAEWSTLISNIIHHTGNFPAEMIEKLESLFGADWRNKLPLLGFEGVINPERILPAVLIFDIPVGFRGLIMVALLAASMSTFDSSVNAATGLFTRDIYQKFIRPHAKTRELIYISWVSVVLLVGLGFLFALTVKNINDIWGWIMMGLVAGGLGARVLRFYWWRLNGAGMAFGALCGLVGGITQRILWPELDERLQFLLLGSVGLVATVVATLLTEPTDRQVLENFYKTTRPFGFWGPLKNCVSDQTRYQMSHEHRNDLLALPFAFAWHICLLLLPMQLIIHAYQDFAITLAVFVIGIIGMYIFWYRNLPSADRQKNK